MDTQHAWIRWANSFEVLELDPENLPSNGSFIRTLERVSADSAMTSYRALVVSASQENGKSRVVLQYRAADQAEATAQQKSIRWGTSTLSWTTGKFDGDATWVDEKDAYWNGTAALTFPEAIGKFSCEIWTGARWEVWPVEQVLQVKDATVRCYECHGRITLTPQSKEWIGQSGSPTRTRAHFEHKPAHLGCSLVFTRRDLNGLTTSGTIVQSPTGKVSTTTEYLSEDDAEKIIGSVTETEKQRLILARVGQGKFRSDLLKAWEEICSVIGCGPKTVLVASHVVAWQACKTNEERIDVNNGLLLTPNLDKLFDRGLISFLDDGLLVLEKGLSDVEARALGIGSGMRLRIIRPGVLPFLRRHRQGGEWRILV